MTVQLQAISLQKKHQFLLVILLSLSLLLLSSSTKAQLNVETMIPPGAKLYTQYCSGCHGVKMEAFVSTGWKHGTSKEEIRASVMTGRGDGAMPAWGEILSAEQISDLVAYLRDGFENLGKYDLEEEEFDLTQVFESSDLKFKLELVADGMEKPWGMTFLDDGSMLVTEKEGKLFHLSADGQKAEVKNPPAVNDGRQGGLLDVTLHPSYDENGWLYLSYSISKEEDGETLNTTAVSRYKLKDNAL
ncbi:MAG: PQQ-dependent sugar dehydrogenase, partial [Cyclobacteriaceae bacterium]